MHHLTLNMTATALSLTMLAACGDGGGETVLSFTEARDRTSVMLHRLPTDVTPIGAMPDSGDATYSGFIGIESDRGTETYGELTLTASFADQTLRGTAENFVDEFEQHYDGALDVNGAITGNEIAGDISGHLSVSDEMTLDVDATFNGSFRGDTHEALFADIDGQVTTNESGMETTGDIIGAFIAER